MINRLVIIGVGLIGGSLALALRQAGAVKEIIGVGRSQENLNAALHLGIIDRAESDPASAVKNADIVLLAVPVAAMQPTMAALAPHLEPHTIITDVGSTKRDVLGYAHRHLPKHLTHFIAAHPIAGAEQSGATAARANLFQNRNVVITPLPVNDPAAVNAVSQMWVQCGAKVSSMTPQRHDEIFAAVSHLPHLLSFALVDEIAARPNAEELFAYAASGFRDFTRIAGSHPEMWRDICLANRDALLHELDAYQGHLENLRTMLEQGDGAALENVFEHARNARTQWLVGLSQ
ncbi:MAG: prephenate dehydrogenase/arogenate dehydrogenase family protein [Sulfuricellaceae bacterium]|nr:prephenate dehydrogenase/arogenate dehydrogenase family protein [Sulfuricellaceae bacterium]